MFGYIVAVLSIVLGVVLAIFLLANPGQAVVGLIWVVGVWAIVIGVSLIVGAITARIRVSRAVRSGSAAAPAQG